MSSRMNMINGRPTEDASDLAVAVRYDVEQIRSEEEKARARANIGITGSGGGSGGGVALVVHMTQSDGDYEHVIDKTYSEVVEAAKTGLVVLIDEVEHPGSVAHFNSAGPNNYGSGYSIGFGDYYLSADSVDDYPYESGVS